jgi:proteasome activator subunit 4
MLETFLPRLSASLNSILATQSFCVHFLPTSHPQYYLPATFRLWESFNSSIWDEQWLDMTKRLAVRHLDPAASDPDIVEELRVRAREAGELVEGVRVEDMANDDVGAMDVDAEATTEWRGIRKDVGIFTETQWAFIMTKCLRAMGSSPSSRPSSA